MHGWLDGRPTLMRLPYSSNFSKFYPDNFTDPVSEGDCGSLVIDQNTKKTYRFIVAASMEGSVAYIVSADEILQDITSKLGQECARGLSLSKKSSVSSYATSDKRSQAAINLLPGKTADVSSKDITVGATSLLWAAINGHATVVKLLLKNGADIESKDTVYGRTPISWAAVNGHAAIVRLLLDSSADIEAKDQAYSPTPLSLAAMNGHVNIAKMLLEERANIESVVAYPIKSTMQCGPPTPALTEDASHAWPPSPLPDLEWNEDASWDYFVKDDAADDNETMKFYPVLHYLSSLHLHHDNFPLVNPAEKSRPTLHSMLTIFPLTHLRRGN